MAQVAPLVVAFALTPLLLHRLGLDQFGIWSLALVVLTTLTTLDGGLSASLARFFAIYAARGASAEAGRLLLGALLLFLVLGLVLSLAAFPLVPVIVPLLHVPRHLTGQAVSVLRWLPPLAMLGLMADAIAAVLEGNSQFRGLSAAMLASSAAYAALVVILLWNGGNVSALLVATGVRYAMLAVMSVLFAARQLTFERPLLPSRIAARQLWHFSSRMQLSAVTGFVNTQMDAFVIAAFLPVRYVGLYGIGMQAASAVRSVPLYVFPPMLARFARTFGNEGRGATVAQFETMERRWLPAVLGYGVIAVAAIGFGVPVWLGNSYVLGGLTAAILLVGYTAHVGLTGMRTCYVRAIGRPGLETRYSLVWTVTNAVLTVPCALVAGELGVVAATAGTGVLASVYFVWLCRRREQLALVLPPRRWCLWAPVAVIVTVCGELLILQTKLHGYLPFALTAIPALVALLILYEGARPVLSTVARLSS
jgi:O-antigen/teichoic acid export membrane protein